MDAYFCTTTLPAWGLFVKAPKSDLIICSIISMKKSTAIQTEQTAAPDKGMLSRNLLFLIAFVEGGSVMAVELAGAKMIAPYYGTSMYVWASVLAVTLGGLTAGYFLGGWATYRFPPKSLLFWELLTGTAFIALMPLLAITVMPAVSGLGLRAGSLISAISFMIVPLICMGMVSPTIIQLSNTELKGAGKTAGTVYAVSTVGGIVMTLLMGFYFLPEWGIRKSIYITTLLLGLMPVLLMVIYAKYKVVTAAGAGVVVLMLIASQKPFTPPGIPLKYLYKSEGILGQVSVLENPDPETGKTYRHMFINHIPQTWVDVQFIPFSEWGYPHHIATLTSIKPPGSKVLLVGLGGGSIAMEFKNMGFQVDVIEIDTRIPKIAKEYFGFTPEGMNIFIDDGRHFIRTTGNVYDIVFIDVLNGDTQPHHMFTIEAMEEIKKILSPEGILVVNNQGYLHGQYGLGARSIYKTLLEVGFKVQHYHAGDETVDGDIHFFASLVEQDFRNISHERLNECCQILSYTYDQLITQKPVNTADAFVLTDDVPRLEMYNSHWNEEWRSRAISGILLRESQNKIPFFR